jgi:hypothetical protein
VSSVGVCQAMENQSLCLYPAQTLWRFWCNCGHRLEGWMCDQHDPRLGVQACPRCRNAGHNCPLFSERGLIL